MQLKSPDALDVVSEKSGEKSGLMTRPHQLQKASDQSLRAKKPQAPTQLEALPRSQPPPQKAQNSILALWCNSRQTAVPEESCDRCMT